MLYLISNTMKSSSTYSLPERFFAIDDWAESSSPTSMSSISIETYKY